MGICINYVKFFCLFNCKLYIQSQYKYWKEGLFDQIMCNHNFDKLNIIKLKSLWLLDDDQVYAPRLDDPYSGTFERCSTDTYTLYGPCTYQICYLYLYRTGYDGWKPDSVTVYGYYTKSVTFYYNTWIPNGVWYGFDECHGASASAWIM